MNRRIVPVEPASGYGEIVVIEVQQEGVHEFDVRLVGCEGENPYIANIKQSQVSKLKQKFKGTSAEWEAVLAHFLFQKQLGPDQANLLDGVRMAYTLREDSLEVSIRQDVQGIKVTWGEILLSKDDEFEFNPFEWAQASAQAHSQTLRELAEVRARIDGEKETIRKLHAQLDDFIETKNEAETAMLQRFMDLLNEKKRKIRDQSRLLAGAKVDKSTALAIQSARTETPRKAGPSRASKRKAPTRVVKTPREQESSSDQMEVDEAKTGEDGGDAENVPGAATPDRGSDIETESEDEAPDSSLRGGLSETLKSTATVAQPTKEAKPSSDGPPPPRSLPFGRARTRSKGLEKKPSPPPADNDDDETDDEEL